MSEKRRGLGRGEAGRPGPLERRPPAPVTARWTSSSRASPTPTRHPLHVPLLGSSPRSAPRSSPRAPAARHDDGRLPVRTHTVRTSGNGTPALRAPGHRPSTAAADAAPAALRTPPRQPKTSPVRSNRTPRPRRRVGRTSSRCPAPSSPSFRSAPSGRTRDSPAAGVRRGGPRRTGQPSVREVGILQPRRRAAVGRGASKR